MSALSWNTVGAARATPVRSPMRVGPLPNLVDVKVTHYPGPHTVEGLIPKGAAEILRSALVDLDSTQAAKTSGQYVTIGIVFRGPIREPVARLEQVLSYRVPSLAALNSVLSRVGMPTIMTRAPQRYTGPLSGLRVGDEMPDVPSTLGKKKEGPAYPPGFVCTYLEPFMGGEGAIFRCSAPGSAGMTIPAWAGETKNTMWGKYMARVNAWREEHHYSGPGSRRGMDGPPGVGRLRWNARSGALGILDLSNCKTSGDFNTCDNAQFLAAQTDCYAVRNAHPGEDNPYSHVGATGFDDCVRMSYTSKLEANCAQYCPGGTGTRGSNDCASSDMIYFVQTQLGVKADGIWGPKSQAALVASGQSYKDVAGGCDGSCPAAVGSLCTKAGGGGGPPPVVDKCANKNCPGGCDPATGDCIPVTPPATGGVTKSGMGAGAMVALAVVGVIVVVLATKGGLT